MLVLAVLFIIYLVIRVENLKSDVYKLKQEKKNSLNINFCPKCGYGLREDLLPNVPKKEIIEQKQEQKVEEIIKKPTFSETEIKNSTILLNLCIFFACIILIPKF